MLLDSNIIIYSTQDEYSHLKDFFNRHSTTLSASEISYVEVVGFHKLADDDIADLEKVFAAIEIIPITTAIIRQAVCLRQSKRMSLGDSIIAATALCHEIPLVTRNTSDFEWIDGLVLINPVDQP